MPKAAFVDFKAVKTAVTMEKLLEHYGLLDRFKRNGDNLSGPCPLHKGSNPTQFRVSLSKNVWNCFSECKNGGNSLDFIARMEDITIHAAALHAIEWFKLDPKEMSAESEPPETKDKSRKGSQPAKPPPPDPEPESAEPNKPLKFRLDKLTRDHPYFAERGLTLETVIDFDAGHCAKGTMAGRMAIPIRNPQGEIVAYVGRWPGEPPEGTPKYKLPQGFRKSLELFNIDRAIKESAEKPLVIVEGFIDCMKLHQLGCRRVVALMGSTMSPAQEELIRSHTKGSDQIVLMLDEDEAGRAGRDDISARLAKFAFLKAHCFGKEGCQPEHLSSEELAEVVG